MFEVDNLIAASKIFTHKHTHDDDEERVETEKIS